MSAAPAQDIAPYFDELLARLDAGDPRAEAAFGRHVHWGFWPDPAAAIGTPEDYAAAAERLCRMLCDVAGIRDGQKVLDVGCGFGGTIASLNERFSNLDLTGANIDPRQIARAAAKVKPRPGNGVRFTVGDACKLDMPAAAFDHVLAVECIFHFDSRAAFFRGAAKALKPGGRLTISDFVPPEETLDELKKRNPGDDASMRQAYGHLHITTTVEDYRRLADAAGLSLLEVHDITAGTLPTYDYLQSDFKTRSDRASARVHSKATSRIEIACRTDLLRYTILSFGRRADALAESA